MTDATNPTVRGEGHEWRIGRFQSDDESECRLCGVQSDEPAADESCEARAAIIKPTGADQ
jgi:hypothetical protein